MQYNPEEYWSKRFKRELNLGVVGDISLGLEYNNWLYRARIRALDRLLKDQHIQMDGRSVLDIGVGSGFYIQFWEKKCPASITGIDITEKSISTLEKLHPMHRFIKSDITADLAIEEKFDIITCFDILFHIVDEGSFNRAISNIARLSHEGSYVIISDCFLKEPIDPGFHEYHRTFKRYCDILKDNGFRFVAIKPVFYLMSTPVDEGAVREPMRPVISGLWRITTKMLSVGANHAWIKKLVGNVLGGLLYLSDLMILNVASDSPGTKLLLAEKTSYSDRLQAEK